MRWFHGEWWLGRRMIYATHGKRMEKRVGYPRWVLVGSILFWSALFLSGLGWSAEQGNGYWVAIFLFLWVLIVGLLISELAGVTVTVKPRRKRGL